mmetsp:Transcript_14230/g.20944  ORF Transcript_14230/g.20944 Transcript_14230/m.20944 type:complete len:293 (-) Transcript_14230:380-1258(-)
MTPGRQSLLGPVISYHLLHSACAFNQPAVVLVRDEERMGPLRVQKIQLLFLLRGKPAGAVVSLAPGGNHQAPPRLQHSDHLFDVLLLVGHVLPGLTGPDQVESVVRKGHVHGVHNLELSVGHPLLLVHLCASLHLGRTDGDSSHFRLRQGLGKVAGGAPKPAAHVQDLGGLDRVRVVLAALVPRHPRKLHHPVDELVPGLDGGLLEGALGPVFVAVVAQVDVLPPVLLQHPLLSPCVVLSGHGVVVLGGLVGPGRLIQLVLQPEQGPPGQTSHHHSFHWYPRGCTRGSGGRC